VIGLVAGFVGMLTGHHVLLVAVVAIALGIEFGKLSGDTDEIPAAGEIRKEPWYALFGVILGTLPVIV
jgi:ABC-type spermidine/putrescine transport system permease subunit II